jgi:hypothetical protein
MHHPASAPSAGSATRKLPLVLLAFLPLLLAPLTAPAKEVRFPETGLPAYAFILPDDWTSRADTSGNLIMVNPNRTVSFVILIAKSSEPIDVVASDAFTVAKATPSDRKEPAEISGHKGRTYFATIMNPKGLKLDVEMTVVQVGDSHIGSASLLFLPGLSSADETAARLVRNGLKLVTE